MHKRTANYCPICSTSLEQRETAGRQRPVCPACGYVVYFDPKVAVVVFIKQDDKVLLIRRAMNPGIGKWAFPAGFVDYDEAPTTAAVREVLEETGLHVEIEGLLDVFPRKDDGLADIIIAYSAHIVGGTLNAGDDAVDVGWFAKDNLPELVFYPSIALAERWQAGHL